MSSINPGDSSNVPTPYQAAKEEIRREANLQKHSLADASLGAKIMAVIRGFFAGAAVGDPRAQVKMGGGRVGFHPVDFITGARMGVRIALDAIKPGAIDKPRAIEFEFGDNKAFAHLKKKDPYSTLVKGTISRAATETDSQEDQTRGSVTSHETIFYNNKQVEGNNDQFVKIKEDLWVPLEAFRQLYPEARKVETFTSVTYRDWDITMEEGNIDGFVNFTRPTVEAEKPFDGDEKTDLVKVYKENEIKDTNCYVYIGSDRYVSKNDLDRFLRPSFSMSLSHSENPEPYVKKDVYKPGQLG